MVTDGAELHFADLSGTLISYDQFQFTIFAQFLEVVDDLLGVMVGSVLLEELSSYVLQVV